MKPLVKLDEFSTGAGDLLTLYEHDGAYSIHFNGEGLMHSRTSASETLLGERGVARIQAGEKARVLIGGLGLGFTLRAVVDGLRAKSKIEVVELLPEIVEWNRNHLTGLNGMLVDKQRVSVRIADVTQVIRDAKPGSYNAIMLDVDNGPVAMVDENNTQLYSDEGLAMVFEALADKGRAVFWSAEADKAFEKRLRKAGFEITAVPAKTHNGAKRAAYLLYVADKH